MSMSIFCCYSHVLEFLIGDITQVENKETKEIAAAKVIPVAYEDEIEDFVTEVRYQSLSISRSTASGRHSIGVFSSIYHQAFRCILL